MAINVRLLELMWSLTLGISLLQLGLPDLTYAASEGSGNLTFAESPKEISLGNDQIEITFGKSGGKGMRGSVRSLKYKFAGAELELLQTSFWKISEKYSGYWDMHWYDSVKQKQKGRPNSPPVTIVRSRNSKCSFGEPNKTTSTKLKWDGKRWVQDKMVGVTYHQEMKSTGEPKSTPVNTRVHYAVKEGVSGVYATLQVDHSRTDIPMLLSELRLVLMLNPKIFDYSYVADDRQRLMPTRRDISKHWSSKLDFKEARLLTRPENPSMAGEVDHKYIHSLETKDSRLYGWISSELRIGVWIISPNKWEYLGGGPTKQELSVQTGPKLLAMLHSRHYGTPSINLKAGEEWNKVFGPFLIYVNQALNINDLISDAKARAVNEVKSWPYEWVPFSQYKPHDLRGTVVGRLVAQPQAWDNIAIPAGSWVGLTDEKSSTSNWEDEVKSYQFWGTTNAEGDFTIYNVRPGKYIIQFIVHGVLVDSLVLPVVTVGEEWVSNVGEVVVCPVQRGPTIWEIGYPDRSAGEFMIPPGLHHGRAFSMPSGSVGSPTNEFRQYGLWENYLELYPETDPVFKVGESNWSSDWYFAHVLRPDRANKKFRTTQREITFELPGEQLIKGDYTLRLAIAGAHQAAVEVRINDPSGSPLFDTGPFGKDNALARAGVHGHYYQFSVSLSHMNLRPGWNSIYLRQRRNDGKFNYVMYDYLRLEAPGGAAGGPTEVTHDEQQRQQISRCKIKYQLSEQSSIRTSSHLTSSARGPSLPQVLFALTARE